MQCLISPWQPSPSPVVAVRGNKIILLRAIPTILLGSCPPPPLSFPPPSLPPPSRLPSPLSPSLPPQSRPDLRTRPPPWTRRDLPGAAAASAGRRPPGRPGSRRDSRGLSGQLGVWRPRHAGWGWPGGLFLQSNNPNLSGGELGHKKIGDQNILTPFFWDQQNVVGPKAFLDCFALGLTSRTPSPSAGP